MDTNSVLAGYQPSIGEGVDDQTVTVTASYADNVSRTSSTAITVSVAGAGGTRGAEANDFTAVSDFTVTIPANAASGSATFSLTTTDDERVEGAEDLAVSGTASGFTVNGAVVTIDDDDAPPAIVLSVDADDAVSGVQSSVGEASAAKTARVTASVPGGTTFESAVAVTVSVDGAGGTGEAEAADFAAVADFTVTIPAGQSSGSATFSLDPTEDVSVEGAEDITVSGTSAAVGVRVISTSIEITDNDDPPTASLSVDLDSGTPGDQDTIGEGDAAVTATVTGRAAGRFPRPSSRTVTVSVTVSGEGTTGKAESSDFSTDKTNNTFDMTIPAGGRSSSETFTLTITDDEVLDITPETITLSGAADFSGMAVTADSITIDSDNDTGHPTIALSVDTDNAAAGVQSSVNEGAVKTVKVTAAFPAGAKTLETATVVSVLVSTAGTVEANDFSTDKTNDTFDITIPAGARSGSATFTLTTVDDNLVGEGTETVILSGTTTAPGFTTPASASFTIPDADDDTLVVISQDVEPSSTETFEDEVREGGGPYEGVRVRLAIPYTGLQKVFESEATFTVQVTDAGLATAEADDFSTDKTDNTFDITFPAGSYRAEGTFKLTITDDALYERDEQIILTGTTDTPGVRVFRSEITIIDNEARPAISMTIDTDLEVFGDQDYIPEGITSRKVKVTASVAEGSAERELDTAITVRALSVTAAYPDDFSLSHWGDIPYGGGRFSITIPAGADQASKYFILSTVEDSSVEGGETFNIAGSANAYTDNGVSAITPDVVTIDDNDNPSTIYLRVDTSSTQPGVQKTVAEPSQTRVLVTTSLPNGAPGLSANQTVTVSVVGGGGSGQAEASDFSAVPSFDMTIARGDDMVSRNFTLFVTDDTVVDVLPEVLTVSGSSSGYTVRNDFIVIEEDNDTTTVNLSVDTDSTTPSNQNTAGRGY